MGTPPSSPAPCWVRKVATRCFSPLPKDRIGTCRAHLAPGPGGVRSHGPLSVRAPQGVPGHLPEDGPAEPVPEDTGSVRSPSAVQLRNYDRVSLRMGPLVDREMKVAGAIGAVRHLLGMPSRGQGEQFRQPGSYELPQEAWPDPPGAQQGAWQRRVQAGRRRDTAMMAIITKRKTI